MASRLRNTNAASTVGNENAATLLKGNPLIARKYTGTARAALGDIKNNVHLSKPIDGKEIGKKKEFLKPTLRTRPSTTTTELQKPKVPQATLPTKKLVCRTSLAPKPSLVSTSIVGISKYAARTTLKKQPSTLQLPNKVAASHSKPIVVPPIPKNSGIKDVDKENESNIFLLGEYTAEIHAYLRDVEVDFAVGEDFLNGHKVTQKMRETVVDWLVDLQVTFDLLLETLHLGIGLFDRFLEKTRTVTRERLQLAGACALWIASKIEEKYPQEVEGFVYMADNAFKKADIYEMEALYHKALDFRYNQPLSIHFLRRYSSVSEALPKQHSCGKYILELALVSYKCRHIQPSKLAAAALFLAVCVVDTSVKPKTEEVWTNTLAHYSTYTYNKIEPIIKQLAVVIIEAESSKRVAVKNKYASNKFHRTSNTINQDIIQEIAGTQQLKK